jgi:hypothetical protein
VGVKYPQKVVDEKKSFTQNINHKNKKIKCQRQVNRIGLQFIEKWSKDIYSYLHHIFHKRQATWVNVRVV